MYTCVCNTAKVIMAFSRFQRMMAIPEEEYQHLKSVQQVNDPLQSRFLSLSNTYKQQGHIRDPEIRNFQQGETLSHMIDLKEKLRQRLVGITPRPFKTRAEGLFQFISDKVRVNETGEIQDGVSGTTIAGSNISDLIQHAVRDRRRNIGVPPGWESFLTTLKTTNAPRVILNHDTLAEMAGNVVATPKVKPLPSKLPIAVKKSTVSVKSRRPAMVKSIKTEVTEGGRKTERTTRHPSYFLNAKTEPTESKRRPKRTKTQPSYFVNTQYM